MFSNVMICRISDKTISFENGLKLKDTILLTCIEFFLKKKKVVF